MTLVSNTLEIGESKDYSPKLLMGYDHFWYANLENPIDDAGFSNFRLGIIEVGETVPAQIINITKDVISGSDYRFYATITPDFGLKKNTCYRLVIYDISDDSLIYTQPGTIQFITVEDLDSYALLEFRHSSNLDNYNYQAGFFAGKYNSIFLDMNQTGDGFEYVDKSYRELSTGKLRTQKKQRHKTITLESYLFDEKSNDFLASLSMHDDIKINSEPVTIKQGHEHSNNRDFNLNFGTVSFYINKYSTINYSA